MSKIAVFGATGGTGRLVVEQALAQGHEVVVLAREPARVTARVHRIVEGDVRDVKAVREAVEGVDAVIVTLGMPARDPSRLREQGTRAIVAAMEDAGVDRLVVLSVLGAHESHAGLDWVTRWLVFPLWLKQTILDHEAQEDVVRSSSLAWTLVRPPHLTDRGATGRWTAGFDVAKAPPAMSVPRADLACFLLHSAVTGAWAGQAVGVVKHLPALASEDRRPAA